MISLKWHQQTVSICPISTAPCTPVRAATARRARICLLPQNLLPSVASLASSFLAQSELAWLRFWARLPPSVEYVARRRVCCPLPLSLWLNVVAGKRGYSIQGCWVGWKRERRKEGRNNRYHAGRPRRPNGRPLFENVFLWLVELVLWVCTFLIAFIKVLCRFGYCNWKGNR